MTDDDLLRLCDTAQRWLDRGMNGHTLKDYTAFQNAVSPEVVRGLVVRAQQAEAELGRLRWMTADRYEQVGWQWRDDGIADGGLLPLDTTLQGDRRCVPVYRRVSP